jgi:hypothetical protein
MEDILKNWGEILKKYEEILCLHIFYQKFINLQSLSKIN